MDDIAENLAKIRGKIAKAAGRAGRDPSQIDLMAVTKNVPFASIQQAWAQGIRRFGESRVQEAAEKISDFTSRVPSRDDVSWHMIGHLQSNKTKKALDLFDAVDTVDSIPLAERLHRDAKARGLRLKCLVEVNIGGEPAKSGLAPGELSGFLDRAADWNSLTFEGLLVIPPAFDDPELARPYFRQARTLLEQNRGKLATGSPVLSMGMSHDFEVAVEEGATVVRIGTAIFGARPATVAR